MFRLHINDEEVELNQRVRIQLSKMLIDLSDLSSRGLKITNSLLLPFTQQNDKLTGYPSRLSSNNEAFEVNQQYVLESDTSGVISTGDVVIKSFDDKKGIKIQLVEGYNFWAQSGKRLLNDLVLPDSFFQFTTANMNALKVITGSVFLTALHSATGDDSNTALNNYTYTRPCYYFRNVLTEIVEQLGYTLDFGDSLDMTNLASVGCLSNAEKFWCQIMVSDLKMSHYLVF